MSEEKKEMKIPEHQWLVIANREEIYGEFKHLFDAKIFNCICALHGEPGDKFEVVEVVEGYLIQEREDSGK